MKLSRIDLIGQNGNTGEHYMEPSYLDDLSPEDWDDGRAMWARNKGPSHYTKYAIQPYEYCYRNGLNNLQSEAISYITRYKDKGGKIDLEKAIHTLELLIGEEYGNGQ